MKKFLLNKNLDNSNYLLLENDFFSSSGFLILARRSLSFGSKIMKTTIAMIKIAAKK